MMATLVLTGVGTLIGGPVGGAVGALLGQAVDARLFAPSTRQGARLPTLAVQTSTYGGDIPKLFGRMRVAGTVIWATDLRERRSTSGGGKGRPTTVDYAYSASFAVLLSGRRVRSVGRIWADGKLLRGAAGDYKTPTGFRLWTGDEDQPVDPLIASAEGAPGAPAYRGLAYAVLEDLELADFGNRIPSLTFEVTADDAPVPVPAIAAELSGGAIEAGPGAGPAGFAAGGDTLRAAIEPLVEAFGITLSAGADGLRLVGPADAALVVAAEDGASVDGKPGRRERSRGRASGVPEEVSLGYYDPDRDYQSGLQRATRGGGRGSERLALPAALSAADAKALALARLARLAAARESLRLRFGPRCLGLRPGVRVRVDGMSGDWRIARIAVERLVVEAELVRLPAPAALPPSAAAGRAVSEPDAERGPTRLLLFELPADGEILTAPRVFAAAAGASEGWRPVPLSASRDGGASWSPAGRTAPAAAIGATLTALGAGGGSAAFDTASRVDVELLRDDDWLENRSDAALAAGDNAALIGGEIVQFGVATPLGGRRFRLSRLLRGRRGTEWAAGAAEAGAPFVLLDRARLLSLDLAPGSVGGEIRFASDAPADDATAPASLLVAGEGLRPPSPVHLRGSRAPGGGLTLAWVRRSRIGWAWLDGADTPLGEEREAYRVTVSAGPEQRTWEAAEPGLEISAAALAGLTGPLEVEIVQLGTYAASHPARLVVD
jgi:hypothetical protein